MSAVNVGYGQAQTTRLVDSTLSTVHYEAKSAAAVAVDVFQCPEKDLAEIGLRYVMPEAHEASEAPA